MAERPGSIFFMHIMKTAGTSFAQHIDQNFPPSQVYPDVGGPRHEDQYWKIEELHKLTERRKREIQIYHGHFPFVVGQMLDVAVTLTILREPVERTISHLRHCRRHFQRHHGRALEEIYEDPWHHPTLFRNYQVKQFAFTPADAPRADIDVLDVDEDRFKVAVENLRQVTVLGLTDRYQEFTEAVSQRLGWTFDRPKVLQVSPGEPKVPAALRQRIAADSAADTAFYEQALSQYLPRRHG